MPDRTDNAGHGIAVAALDHARKIIEQGLVLLAQRRVVGGEMRAGVDTDTPRHLGDKRIVLAPQFVDLGLRV